MSDTTSAPADPAAMARLLLGATLNPPPVTMPDYTGPSSHEGRGILSLLGEGLGGGQQYGSTAEREQAGLSAAQAAGMRMLMASDYSMQPHTLGSIIGQGMAGAGESLARSQSVSAGERAMVQNQQMAAQQAQLERIKAALPLLTLQQRMQAAGTLQSPLAGGGPNTSIGAAGGAPLAPFVASNLPAGVSTAEDQMVRTVLGEAANQGTTGQQAVAAVIKNRMDAGKQGAQDVIFAPNQFEPWNNPKTRAGLEAIDPNSKAYQDVLNNAVRPILAGTAQDPTGGATHFYSPTAQKALGRAPPAWAEGQTPTVIGQHQFYKLGYNPAAAPGAQAAVAPSPNAPVQIPPTTPPIAGNPPPPPGQQAATPAPVQVAGPGGPTEATPFVPTNKGPLEVKSLQEYQRENPFTPPPDQARTFQTDLAPETLAGMAEQERNAKALVAQLTNQYHINPDPKLLTDIATATDKYNTILNGNATLRQAAIEKGSANYLAAHKDWQTNLETSFNKAHELDQSNQNNLVAARQAEDMKSGNKMLETMDTGALKASNMNAGLMQMYPYLGKLPGGLVGSVLQSNPGALNWMKSAGIVSPETADATRIIQGLTSYMATEMKPAGLGSMREYEFDAFRAALPDLLKSEEGQKQAMGMLMQMNDRIQNEADWLRGHYNRPVDDASAPGGQRSAYNLAPGYWKQMDAALGPVVPHYTGDPGDIKALQAYRAKQLPGRPYRDIGTVAGPDGQPIRIGGRLVTREYTRVAPVPGAE